MLKQGTTGQPKKVKLKKPKRPCPFCSRDQSNLKRHMIRRHKDTDEIKYLLTQPRKKQAVIAQQLKRMGMATANKKLIANKEATIHCEKRSQRIRNIINYVMCSECGAVIARANFNSHRSRCTFKTKSSNILPTPIAVLNASCNDAFTTDVLDRITNDEEGKICKTDKLCLLVGKVLYQTACSKGPKKPGCRNQLMRNVRRLASLFLNVQNAAAEQKVVIQKVEEIFNRKHFDFLETAVIRMSEKEDGGQKHGLKLSLGYLLKKVCTILKGTLLTTPGNDDKASEVDKFLDVLKLKWPLIFGDAEYEAHMRRQDVLRKPCQMPDEADLQLLRDFTVRELARFTADKYKFLGKSEYIFLRSLAISRLTLFNARRGGEPARLTLAEWEDAKAGVWLDKRAVNKLDYIDKSIIQRLKVCYQSGKGNGKVVPVTIPQDTEPALHLLADPESRKAANIHPKNTFLFAHENLSLDHANGTYSLQVVCRKAGVNSKITATSVRHRASTLYAALELPEEDRRYFYQHMGHSEEMNRNVYQCPPAVAEVTRVGSFLEWLDNGQQKTTGALKRYCYI